MRSSHALFAFAITMAAPASVAAAPGPAALRAAFGPGARVTWGADAARPSAVSRLDVRLPGADPALAVLELLRREQSALGLAGVELRVLETARSKRQVVVRLQQVVGDVDVYRKGVTAVLDARGARLRALRLGIATVKLGADGPDLGPDGAIEAARRHAPPGTLASATPRVARRILAGPPARRVYQVVLPTVAPQPLGKVSVFVDAGTGEPVWIRQEAIR